LQDEQLITVQGKIGEQTPLRGAYPAIQVTQAVLFTAQFMQFVNVSSTTGQITCCRFLTITICIIRSYTIDETIICSKANYICPICNAK
jgi:hypothetical protein